MTDWMFTGNLNLNEIFVFINVAHKRGLGRGINMVIPTTDITQRVSFLQTYSQIWPMSRLDIGKYFRSTLAGKSCVNPK